MASKKRFIHVGHLFLTDIRKEVAMVATELNLSVKSPYEFQYAVNIVDGMYQALHLAKQLLSK